MSQNRNSSTEVLIVGAGPAGLMMACQLAEHQIPFRIIDKNSSPSNNSGALIVQARTLEIFQQMGIAVQALSEGVIASKLNINYNGKRVTGTDIKDLGQTLSEFPFLLMLEQSQTEKLLLKFTGDHGYSVERGVQLKSFNQEEERTLSVVILPDGSEQIISSKYIIAADGANSTIRNLLKIPFEGKSYPNSIFIVDCKAESDFTPDEINFAFSDSSVSGFFPLKGGRWRIDSNLPPEFEKQERITFDMVEKNFQALTGMNINLQSHEWFSVTRSHQKYAGSVRIQNCFLIGDAAHIHTPVGAQGMNTGLQDAYNLAWKIAFVIRQKAKPSILDTYSSERLGISRCFARYADIVFKVVTSGNKAIMFFRSTVLRLFFTILFPILVKSTLLRQMFFKSISQLNINYRKSILSDQTAAFVPLTLAPKPGDRLPFLEFTQDGAKRTIYQALNPTSFNLLVLADILPEEIKGLAEKYNLGVVLVPNQPGTKLIYTKLGISTEGYLLLRPDIAILC